MKTILIIEDNAEISDNMREIFELQGFRVVNASTGKNGIDLACTVIPDIILCDIIMPDLDGYEIIRELRSNPIGFNIPVICVSAAGEKGAAKLAMDLGANGFVRKPFEIEELMHHLRPFLE